MSAETISDQDQRPDKSRFGICHNCPVTWRCTDNQRCERGIIPDIYRKSETISRAKGVSGNTIADLREVASVWDKSAKYCDECGEPELASRDRRFAAAMREAASILEALRMDS